MARRARVSIEGHLHHAMLLAKPGRHPLAGAAMQQQCLEVLRLAALPSGVHVHGFSLSSTQWHVLVTPTRPKGLSQLMKRLAQFATQASKPAPGPQTSPWEGRYRCGLIAPNLQLAAMMLMDALPSLNAPVADLETGSLTSGSHWAGQLDRLWLTQLPAYWALANTPFGRQAAYGRALGDWLTHPESSAAMLAMARHNWTQGPPEYLAEVALASRFPASPRSPGRPKNLSPIKIN